MSHDDSARWRQIEELLDAALDQDDAGREAFVQARENVPPEVRARVLELLRAERAAGEFLEPGASAPAEASEPGQRPEDRIGPWRLEALIGRGGMGEVYRAVRADGQYRQQAALKVVHQTGPEQLARFENERQILADMNHPHIARLLDGGLRENGEPYMAMEYVEGLPLTEYLQQRAPGLRARLELFLKICAAVAYAHGHLIVHRDIKPDNIRVDTRGEPKLLDFGIAKLTGPGLDAQRTQAVATPNYAAPEQLTGGRITTATDVYGLGALLYVMLCGQPPLALDDLSLPQILDRLLHSEPLPPSQRAPATLAPQLRGDLDAICAKAMAKDSRARYVSVEALAEDVRRHLQARPVLARPPSWRYRAGRALRRHKLAIGAGAAVLLSLLLGLAGTAWQAQQAALERDMARRETARMADLRSSVLQLFRAASTDLGSEQLTARELFRQSGEQIGERFADDPATAAALLQMLGELLLFTEDYAQATRLLEQARALPGEDIDPAVLADVDFNLAQLAYRDGDYRRARALYRQASALWDQDPQRYRAERLGGATLDSQLARTAGDPERAARILADAAREAEEYWGLEHPDTGIVLINLAVAEYYRNDLAAAIAACERAWQVWQALDRTDSPDALNLLANWGLFALRHGQLAEGERRLAEALDLRTELYGASAAQATLMKNLGIAHRLNGRREAGMRLLEQAEWMAVQYAGAGGRLHGSAAFALARAQAEDGATVAAIETLQQALDASGERRFSWRYSNQALLAELLDRPGGESERLFAEAIAGLEDIGESVRNHLADAQWSRARFLARHGEPGAAEAYRKAIASKRAARRDEHFEALLMQAELAALLSSGDPAGAEQQFRAARDSAEQQYGAEHPVTRQIEATWLNAATAP